MLPVCGGEAVLVGLRHCWFMGIPVLVGHRHTVYGDGDDGKKYLWKSHKWNR